MNLQDFLSEHSVSFKRYGEHHHTTQNFVQVDCPYCSPNSRHFRMGLALSGTHASCWKCGSRPIVEVLAKVTRLHWSKAKELLKGLPSHRKVDNKVRGNLELPVGLGELHKVHRKYLISRGFNPEELQELWKIQGIGQGSQLAWRIFIPIHHYGEVVSWTTRSLSDEGKRYHSAEASQESMSMKETLYGIDLVRHTIVVQEGPTDVWAIGPGAVGILGLVFTTAQLLLMSKFPRRIVCFDNEHDAQQRAKKLCRELSVFPGETKNLTLPCKDAAETLKRKPKEIRKLRRMFLE